MEMFLFLLCLFLCCSAALINFINLYLSTQQAASRAPLLLVSLRVFSSGKTRILFWNRVMRLQECNRQNRQMWLWEDVKNGAVTQDIDQIISPGEQKCWTTITAVILRENVISVTSDVLRIPTQYVMSFTAAFWIFSDHIEAPCVIWQFSGALVTPHLIKHNWLWQTSCHPSSLAVCLSAWHRTTTPPGLSHELTDELVEDHWWL